MAEKRIRIKRIYEPPAEDDGFRVLVDRLWPRGLGKAAAQIDLWVKEIAPTTELRKWFDHQPEKFDEFKTRYAIELHANHKVTSRLIEEANAATITLLYAARDPINNHAAVLQSFLSDNLGQHP